MMERGDTRSLYPFAFTIEEEVVIISRLLRRQAYFDAMRDRANGPPSVPPTGFGSSEIA
jgi:hypothetical protein